MREVFEIIPSDGAMSPVEILPEPRAWTIRGDAPLKEALTPGMHKKKMDARVAHGRYFGPPQDG